MLNKIYYILVERYDYFGGHKHDLKKFDNLLDAWNEYKRLKKFDYSYDDGSFSSTKLPYNRFVYEREYNNRFHARSKYEWERIKERQEIEKHNDFPIFDEAELAAIWSLVEDEDIYI